MWQLVVASCHRLKSPNTNKKKDAQWSWPIPRILAMAKSKLFGNKFIQNLVLHTSNNLVWDGQKHIGQAPRPCITSDYHI